LNRRAARGSSVCAEGGRRKWRRSRRGRRAVSPLCVPVGSPVPSFTAIRRGVHQISLGPSGFEAQMRGTGPYRIHRASSKQGGSETSSFRGGLETIRTGMSGPSPCRMTYRRVRSKSSRELKCESGQRRARTAKGGKRPGELENGHTGDRRTWSRAGGPASLGFRRCVRSVRQKANDEGARLTKLVRAGPAELGPSVAASPRGRRTPAFVGRWT
jgi:hypothetical protein